MGFYVLELLQDIGRARGRAVGRVLLSILVIPLLLLSAPGHAMNADGVLLRQLAATIDAEAVAGRTVELSDFARKAQASIDFMRPGGQLREPRAMSVAPWSPAIADRFTAYLWELYRNDLDTLGPGWITQVLGGWQAAGGQVARLSWSVLVDGVSHPFDSVAVFDPAGKLLFDTVLIRTLTDVETAPDGLERAALQTKVAASDTKTVKGRYTVKNFAGSKNLTYEVSLKAEVAPYITAATNDAAATMTASVKTGDAGGSGIWPVADPQVYFGTGGSYQLTNSEAAKTPFKSRIWVSDVFQDGSYQVSGNDLGSGISFDLSFGVSVSGKGVGGSVGIAIPGPGPLILVGSNSSASELFLGDVLYSDNAGFRYRGNFRNGGNFKLSNFLIRTDDNPGETGSVRASIPVYMAHEGVGVLNLTGEWAGTLSPRADYVRGDHVKQPTYTVTADRKTVQVGEDVTVTVRIDNNSSAVAIRDGSVALDAGALGGVLTPKSATVVSFGTIDTNGSQSVSFVLTAVASGQVTFQADVEGRWGSPVPPEVTFRKKISLDDAIGVGDGNGNGSKAQLESPTQDSFESGIGLIRGWACDAKTVEIQIDDGAKLRVAYGTDRDDTVEACGDTDNGFGYTINWNRFGDGNHTLRAFVDGTEFAKVGFTVTTLGTEFLQGVSGQYTLSNFPQTGRDVTVRWSEPHQNFVLMSASPRRLDVVPSTRLLAVSPRAAASAQLESPRQDSFESGVGLIRGWVCDANAVEIQIDDGAKLRVAYGTDRDDTVEACGDANNGFGYTINWNRFGDGDHTLRAFVDGSEFAKVGFTVTTLGVEFLQGVTGQYTLANFPQTGRDVTVRWSEPHQNFVIVDYR
ncbi:MAG: hypothetical protein KDJ54_19835 [Candidatus Competibacteraceae bacterium]|nr:hypothetical protein [Candidatus Competibacteraceae bacterium]